MQLVLIWPSHKGRQNGLHDTLGLTSKYQLLQSIILFAFETELATSMFHQVMTKPTLVGQRHRKGVDSALADQE